MDWREDAAHRFEQTQATQRLFGEFRYRAVTWPCHRRMIVKAEHNVQGANPRFVLTNLRDAPQALYEELYCARGESALRQTAYNVGNT